MPKLHERILNRLKRSSLGLLRHSSKELKGRIDLFDDHFAWQADWKSGLGNGGLLLYAMARNMMPEVIVEIGSARGKSSCSLAMACKDNGRGKVYAIDPHFPNPWSESNTDGDNEQFLRSKLAQFGLTEWCEVIRDTSTNAVKKWTLPIDLIFIDGSHSYEGVKSDFELFQPYFTEKTLVVFHDTAWDYASWTHIQETVKMPEELGVPRYLEELRSSGRPSVTFDVIPGITILDPKIGGHSFTEKKGWPSYEVKV